MRYWFLNLVSFIVLTSCSVDDLPGCEGTGNPYEICREYQYVNGNYNGVNNYFYDDSGSVLISKSTFSASGRKQGSSFYNYNSLGMLSSVEYFNSLSKLVRMISYKYNVDGVLIEEINSIDFNQTKNYNYINGVLFSVLYSENGILTAKDSLEYFSNTTDLYRTLKYENGILSSVVYNEWFGSDLLKETTFDGTGVKMSSLVSRYNNSGLVFEKVFYTQGDNVKIKEFYVYSENKLMEIIKEDGQGNVFERLVYQRF